MASKQPPPRGHMFSIPFWYGLCSRLIGNSIKRKDSHIPGCVSVWFYEIASYRNPGECSVEFPPRYDRETELTLVLSVSGTISWMDITTCSRLYSSSPRTSRLYIGASSVWVARFVLVAFFVCWHRDDVIIQQPIKFNTKQPITLSIFPIRIYSSPFLWSIFSVI